MSQRASVSFPRGCVLPGCLAAAEGGELVEETPGRSGRRVEFAQVAKLAFGVVEEASAGVEDPEREAVLGVGEATGEILRPR